MKPRFLELFYFSRAVSHISRFVGSRDLDSMG